MVSMVPLALRTAFACSLFLVIGLRAPSLAMDNVDGVGIEGGGRSPSDSAEVRADEALNFFVSLADILRPVADVDRWLRAYCEVEGYKDQVDYEMKRMVCQETGAWPVYKSTVGGV